MKMTDKQVKYLEDLKVEFDKAVAYAKDVILYRESIGLGEKKITNNLRDVIKYRSFPNPSECGSYSIDIAINFIKDINATAKRADKRN